MKDGGPAFPRPESHRQWEGGTVTTYYDQEGMTLRDWFAGQALIGLLSNTALQDFREPTALALGPAWFAEQAGIQADAMLAEREKG